MSALIFCQGGLGGVLAAADHGGWSECDVEGPEE